MKGARSLRHLAHAPGHALRAEARIRHVRRGGAPAPLLAPDFRARGRAMPIRSPRSAARTTRARRPTRSIARMYVDVHTYLHRRHPDQGRPHEHGGVARSRASRCSITSCSSSPRACRPSLKLRDGMSKYLLRRLLERAVPRPIVDRRKQGFAAPIGEWLRGPLQPMLHGPARQPAQPRSRRLRARRRRAAAGRASHRHGRSPSPPVAAGDAGAVVPAVRRRGRLAGVAAARVARGHRRRGAVRSGRAEGSGLGMCGIAGIVATDGLRAEERARAAADARRHRAPRPRRRGRLVRRARRARPPPPEHRRPRDRPAAARERGRHDLDRLQRRDLQPRRPAAASSRRTAIATARARDTETIVHAYEQWGDDCVAPLPRHVRVRDLGRAAAPAAARARSPRHQAALLDARAATALLFGSEIKAILASGLVEPRPNEAALPELLGTRYRLGRGDAVRGHPQAAARAPARLRAAGASRRGRYWDVPVGGAPREPPAPSGREAVAALPRAARGVGPPAADDRRAARHVPLRRHRQQRDRRADGADDRPAAPDVLGRVQGARVQRAGRTRARSRTAIGADAHEVVIDDQRLLRRAAAAGLARGRADRAPVERAALLRLGARARARQGRAHRRRQRRAARRLRQVPARRS